MQKLLFMGCSFGTEEALKYAKSTGVYTIVTDYNPPEISHIKRMADEYWMIDVADIDKLEEQCRKENVSGIFAATSEFCLDKTKELCERMGLPFYASDESWACTRDKTKFKRYCQECGVDTPRIWYMGKELTKDTLDIIQYPVIVKPTDSCAQQGISVCENEQELLNGFEMALSKSDSQNVIIEDYIEGVEIAPFYFFVNGKAMLSELDDLVYLPVNGRNNFVFVKDHSNFLSQYLNEIEPKMKKLFQHIGCYNGAGFLQGILKDKKIYFLELGYRLDGIGAWKRNKQIYNYSSVEFMVDYALGRKNGSQFDIQAGLDSARKISGNYLLWARPGKIGRIEGAAQIDEMEGAEIILRSFEAGDEVPEEVSMRQIAFNIVLTANDDNDMRKKVEKINDVLHVYDESGKDMLFYLTDFDSLKWE